MRRTNLRSVVILKRVVRTTRRPAERAVASENCMMPLGPAGLCAFASPQLSRYATAEISEAGTPLEAAALRKIRARRVPVILSAPAVACGSRRIANVSDSSPVHAHARKPVLGREVF